MAMAVYSVPPREMGFLPSSLAGRVTSVLAFPYHYHDDFTRYKLFPSVGKMKYYQPAGTGSKLYMLPFFWKTAQETKLTLYFTEGEKKAARMCQEGFPCAGLGGVWNWLDRGEIIEDFKQLNLSDRNVIYVPDSGALVREDLKKAVYSFAVELQKLGATVKVKDLNQWKK